MLVAAADVVLAAVFDELRTGLVEAERHARMDALLAQGQDPVEVQGAGVAAGLAAAGDLLDAGTQVVGDVYALDHWGDDDGFVLDGQRREDRQPLVGHGLVLDGAADYHIVVAVSPVVRDALQETVDPLGEEVETAVTALADHRPAVGPPRVGVLQQEVGGETGEDEAPRRDFVALVALALHGEVESQRLAGDLTADFAAVHLVLSIDIAMPAPGGNLGTAVPGIPVGGKILTRHGRSANYLFPVALFHHHLYSRHVIFLLHADHIAAGGKGTDIKKSRGTVDAASEHETAR